MPFFQMSVHIPEDHGRSAMPASVSAVQANPSVRTHRLSDGLVVRLSGVLDGQAILALREELLCPLPAGCRDVLIDAGAVESLPDDALAVLVAGASWARTAGARFALSAVSAPLASRIDSLELRSALPQLGASG
jgi:anti-anti-sigma regulatory factor